MAEKQGYVIRVAEQPVFTPEYVQMRQRLARHIQSPWFTVGDNGRVLKEAFVSGHHLGDLPIEDQLDGVRDLLRSLAALVASEGRGSSRSFVDASIAWIERAKLPPDLERSLEDPDFVELLSRGPLSPSHGDVVVSNLVMSDGRLNVIDWAAHRLAFRPFWYDALTIVNCSRYQLANSRGAFDREIEELWIAAGQGPLRVGEARILLAAGWCVATAHASYTALVKDVDFDVHQLMSTVTRLWRRFESTYQPI